MHSSIQCSKFTFNSTFPSFMHFLSHSPLTHLYLHITIHAALTHSLTGPRSLLAATTYDFPLTSTQCPPYLPSGINPVPLPLLLRPSTPISPHSPFYPTPFPPVCLMMALVSCPKTPSPLRSCVHPYNQHVTMFTLHMPTSQGKPCIV